MEKSKWEKAYKGPFTKKLADGIVNDLKVIANPEKNGIHDAEARKRISSKYEEPKNEYDVYIKVDQEQEKQIDES